MKASTANEERQRIDAAESTVAMLQSCSHKSGRLRILLTEGSSTSARQALYCLGPRHAIDIVDPSRFCQCRFSRFVRRWYQCPSYSRDPLGYLRFLVKLLRREKYDVLFPTHEQLYLLSRVRDRLSEHVGLTAPSFAALKRIHDKASFSRLLAALNLPQPETLIVRQQSEFEDVSDFPRYVKAAHGTAGQGVWYVRRADELKKLVGELTSQGRLDGREEFLIQAPVIGDQEDIGGLFQNGRLVIASGVRTRAVGVGGAAMARVTGGGDDRSDDVRRVGEFLDWHGPLALCGIRDEKTGRLVYVEASSRVGETVPGMLSGVNLCELIVRISLGEDIGSLSANEMRSVRTHQTFLRVVSQALAGAGRFDILHELWDVYRKRGVYCDSEDELTRPREDWLSVVPAAAVVLLMLAWPPASQRLVRKTVENYALPASGAALIHSLSHERLLECFD